LAHLHHRECELLKKQALVHCKAGDSRPGPRVRVQVLVRGEQALPVHQVHIVLVVEFVRAPYVVHRGVGRVGRRASELEVLPEGLVHVGVLGRVEPVREGCAVGQPDGVAAREGDQVRCVEVDLVEDGEEGCDVGGRGREPGEGCVAGGKR